MCIGKMINRWIEIGIAYEDENCSILIVITFDFLNKFNTFSMHNLIVTWWFGFFTNFSHGNGWDNLITCLRFNLDIILASDSRKKSYTSKLLTSLLVYDSLSSGSLLSLTILLSLNWLSHPLPFVISMYIFMITHRRMVYKESWNEDLMIFVLKRKIMEHCDMYLLNFSVCLNWSV